MKKVSHKVIRRTPAVGQWRNHLPCTYDPPQCILPGKCPAKHPSIYTVLEECNGPTGARMLSRFRKQSEIDTRILSLQQVKQAPVTQPDHHKHIQCSISPPSTIIYRGDKQSQQDNRSSELSTFIIWPPQDPFRVLSYALGCRILAAWLFGS